MEKTDGAVKLANRAVDTRFEDLNEQEILAAKKSILDTIGVTLAGTTLGNKCHQLVEVAKEMGGKEESTIWGYGGKVPAMMAAFANGAVSHSLDYDDLYDMCGNHPSAPSVPAGIAVMEKTGNLDGKTLITALTVASDTMYRIGLATSPVVQKKYGVFASYAKSWFGAAVISGKILELNHEQMASCIGLAYAQTSGNTQILSESDANLREIYPAFAAKAGVLSAILAARGVSGTRDSLEGKGGFHNVFDRGAYDPTLYEEMGGRFGTTNLTLKTYPACRFTHPFIDATKNIIEKNNLKADQIKKITVKVGEAAKILCIPEEKRKKPKTAMDARFSIPYCIAAYLTRGKVGIGEFLEQSLSDPEILENAQKVNYVFDPEVGQDAPIEPGEVTVYTADGNVYTDWVCQPVGSPENPMSTEFVIDKFRECAGYSIKPLQVSSINKIVDLCMDLENVKDIREILSLIS